jgi:hypothetical protein
MVRRIERDVFGTRQRGACDLVRDHGNRDEVFSIRAAHATCAENADTVRSLASVRSRVNLMLMGAPVGAADAVHRIE